MAVARKKLVHFSSVLIILIGSTCAAWGDHTTYKLLSNERWNTVARGLVSAVPVDVTGARSAADVEQRLRQTIVKRSRAIRRRVNPQFVRLLQQMRQRRPSMQPMRFDRILVATRDGTPLHYVPDYQPGVKRQAGGGKPELTFVYQGFTASEEARTREFLNQTIPAVESVYGFPAQSATVTVRIVKDFRRVLGDLSKPLAHEIEFGFYNVSSNEIILPAPDFGEFQPDVGFLHLVVHAFHGSLIFSYDAWEEGFAQAVALIAYMQAFPDFDPRDDPFYFIQTYDMNNQPALGNNTFFPSSAIQFADDLFGMTPWRIGMSLSAWLKVYAENPNFFLQFNDAYYAQFTPDLAGNVPALKQIAAGIVSTVEGLSFTDWYRRQYVLDTSISIGPKLYSFNFPSVFPDPIGIFVFLYYYRTEMDGNETPLNGTAQLGYSNDEVAFDFNDPDSGLFAEEGNEADIVDGIGGIAPQFFNIGGPNRIFVEVLIDDSYLRLTFPYGVAGEDDLFNPLFGSVLGNDEGEITVTVPGQMPQTTSVSRGVFNFGSSVGVTEPTQIILQFTPTEGKTTAVVRNVGWGNLDGEFYAAVFSAPQTVTTLSHTFPAGFNMMSLPLTPLMSDEADALGVPRNRLLLARYKPNMPGDVKYEIYPNLTTPLAPGVGAWLRVEQDVTVSVQGIPLPSDEDGVVELLRGFNQVGVPHNKTYTLSEVQVKFRDQTYTINQAIASGVLSQGIWGYSPTTGEFSPLTNDSLVEPFKSYFVRSVQDAGVSLIFPAPAPLAQRVNGSMGQWSKKSSAVNRQRGRSASESTVKRKRRASVLEWRVQLSALSSLVNDRYNGFGVAQGAMGELDSAYDVVQPPEIGRFVSLSFPFRAASVSERLAYDIRVPFKGQQAWDFIVESDLSNTDVTLTWNLSGVPSSVRLQLIDLDAGNKKLSMRDVSSYQFRTGEGYTVRRFRVVATVRAKKK